MSAGLDNDGVFSDLVGVNGSRAAIARLDDGNAGNDWICRKIMMLVL